MEPDTFAEVAYGSDVESTRGDGPYVVGSDELNETEPYAEYESESERIARGDLRWSDAKTTSPLPTISAFQNINMDQLVMDYSITQRNLNRIAAAYIFSWIGEWIGFFTYVVFVFCYEKWFGVYYETSPF